MVLRPMSPAAEAFLAIRNRWEGDARRLVGEIHDEDLDRAKTNALDLALMVQAEQMRRESGPAAQPSDQDLGAAITDPGDDGSGWG